MQHYCTRCNYEWLDQRPESGRVADLCGVRRERELNARRRMAAGYYDRIEVIDATAELVARAMENER
jgi:hypothetical protein